MYLHCHMNSGSSGIHASCCEDQDQLAAICNMLIFLLILTFTCSIPRSMGSMLGKY